MERVTATMEAAALLVFVTNRASTLDPATAESLDSGGWDRAWPARVEFKRGSPPRVLDGNHRLAHLGRRGKIREQVPVEVVLR